MQQTRIVACRDLLVAIFLMQLLVPNAVVLSRKALGASPAAKEHDIVMNHPVRLSIGSFHSVFLVASRLCALEHWAIWRINLHECIAGQFGGFVSVRAKLKLVDM
jgi:hypothetical protein